MSLRDDWKKAHRFISLQAIALAGAAQQIWPTIPDDLRASLPHDFLKYLTYGLFTIAVYGIMTKQKGINNAS